MSMPPTSPRLKFIHTHPGRSPLPRRPPRHPSSPSARSRSLELLDQTTTKSVPLITKPEPLPRPRSRSLDGLLDDDSAIDPERSKSSTSLEVRQQNSSTNTSKLQLPTNDKVLESSSTESTIKIQDDSSPMPVPRLKSKNSTKPEVAEAAKFTLQDDSRFSSCSDDSIDKSSNATTSTRLAREDSENTKNYENSDCDDSCDKKPTTSQRDNAKTIRDLTNDKSCTLSKAKSCGAGLDSNESFSSNEYNRTGADPFSNKNNSQRQQGSLLSLHAACAADPKRKRNFMNKCVNKVRSLIKK